MITMFRQIQSQNIAAFFSPEETASPQTPLASRQAQLASRQAETLRAISEGRVQL